MALKIDLLPRHAAELQRVVAGVAPQAEIWAYGSRVQGRSHEGSDLDLVVLPPHEQCAVRLRQALHDSNLPFAVDVLSWSTLPKDFQAEILKVHVTVSGPVTSAVARSTAASL